MKPIMIDLTLENGQEATFIINGNAVFYDYKFVDGVHNNGGWPVRETRKQIREKILKAIRRSENLERR